MIKYSLLSTEMDIVAILKIYFELFMNQKANW